MHYGFELSSSRDLIQYLMGYFSGKKYNYLPQYNGFIKKQANGYSAIFPIIEELKHEIIVKFHVGVRHQEVEKMAQQFMLNLKINWDRSHTLIFNQNVVCKNIPSSLHLLKFSDQETIIKLLIQEWEHKLLPFLNDFCSIEGIDVCINKNADKKTPYVFNETHSLIKGVIAAKLNNNERLNELMLKYRERIEKLNPPDVQIDNFEKLCFHLSASSFN